MQSLVTKSSANFSDLFSANFLENLNGFTYKGVENQKRQRYYEGHQVHNFSLSDSRQPQRTKKS